MRGNLVFCVVSILLATYNTQAQLCTGCGNSKTRYEDQEYGDPNGVNGSNYIHTDISWSTANNWQYNNGLLQVNNSGINGQISSQTPNYQVNGGDVGLIDLGLVWELYPTDFGGNGSGKPFVFEKENRGAFYLSDISTPARNYGFYYIKPANSSQITLYPYHHDPQTAFSGAEPSWITTNRPNFANFEEAITFDFSDIRSSGISIAVLTDGRDFKLAMKGHYLVVGNQNQYFDDFQNYPSAMSSDGYSMFPCTSGPVCSFDIKNFQANFIAFTSNLKIRDAKLVRRNCNALHERISVSIDDKEFDFTQTSQGLYSLEYRVCNLSSRLQKLPIKFEGMDYSFDLGSIHSVSGCNNEAITAISTSNGSYEVDLSLLNLNQTNRLCFETEMGGCAFPGGGGRVIYEILIQNYNFDFDIEFSLAPPICVSDGETINVGVRPIVTGSNGFNFKYQIHFNDLWNYQSVLVCSDCSPFVTQHEINQLNRNTKAGPFIFGMGISGQDIVCSEGMEKEYVVNFRPQINNIDDLVMCSREGNPVPGFLPSTIDYETALVIPPEKGEIRDKGEIFLTGLPWNEGYFDLELIFDNEVCSGQIQVPVNFVGFDIDPGIKLSFLNNSGTGLDYIFSCQSYPYCDNCTYTWKVYPRGGYPNTLLANLTGNPTQTYEFPSTGEYVVVLEAISPECGTRSTVEEVKIIRNVECCD